MADLILQTKDVSIDEYNAYFDVDLDIIAKGKRKALSLLSQAQDDIDLYISINFRLNMKERYADLSELQKENYKKAVIHQLKYKLELGDVDMNTGINEGSNSKSLTSDDRFLASISAKSIQFIRVCGLTSPYAAGSGRRGIFPYGW